MRSFLDVHGVFTRQIVRMGTEVVQLRFHEDRR